MPVALPPLVGVIAFLYLYGESGMATRLVGNLVGSAGAPWRLTGPGAILLVHTYSMYVYFYLFTRAALAFGVLYQWLSLLLVSRRWE